MVVALTAGRSDGRAFLGSAVGMVALIGLAAVGNYPYLVSPRGDPPTGGMTVQAAASSNLTLTVMLIIAAIGLPVVLAYTTYVYKTFKGRVVPGEVDY